MSEYKPQQRQVAARMLTPVGWVSGILHTPIKATLVEYLNQQNEFVTVTHASVAGQAGPVEFLAVQRRAIAILVPLAGHQEQSGTVGDTDLRGVVCIMEDATIEGTLEVATRIRMSDFFSRRQDFVAIGTARVRWVDPAAQHSLGEGHPLLLVQTARIIGVTEL